MEPLTHSRATLKAKTTGVGLRCPLQRPRGHSRWQGKGGPLVHSTPSLPPGSPSGARHAPWGGLAPAGPLCLGGPGSLQVLRSWRGVWPGPTGPAGRTHWLTRNFKCNLNNSTRWVIQPLAPAPAMWPFSCWVSRCFRHVKSRSQPGRGSSLVLLGAGPERLVPAWQTPSTSTPGSHPAMWALRELEVLASAQGGLLSSLGPAPAWGSGTGGARSSRC